MIGNISCIIMSIHIFVCIFLFVCIPTQPPTLQPIHSWSCLSTYRLINADSSYIIYILYALWTHVLTWLTSNTWATNGQSQRDLA